MNSREALERFNELNNNNKISCTEDELNNFLMCGLLLKNKNTYVTRNNTTIKIDLIKTKDQNFDINLSSLIVQAEQLAKENNIFRIYCMTEGCYNIYKEQGLIITKQDKEYYKYFEGELWLVNLIK